MEIFEKKKVTTKPISRNEEVERMSKEYISLLKNDTNNIYIKEFVDTNGMLIHLRYVDQPHLSGYAEINISGYLVERLIPSTINNHSSINTIFKLFLSNTFYYSFSPTANCQLMSFGGIASFVSYFTNLSNDFINASYFEGLDKTKLKYKPFNPNDLPLTIKRIIRTIFEMLRLRSHLKNMVLIDVVNNQLPIVDQIFSNYYIGPGMSYTNTRGTPMTIKIFKIASLDHQITPLK